MKNKIIYPILLVLLAVFGTSSFAQDHSMHMNHQQVSQNRNVYLKIMDSMMVQMEHAEQEKTAEKTFLAQMIPHHLGAIAMSKHEIAHGKSFEMIQLAKSILAEQQTEIGAMRIWLAKTSVVQVPAGKQYLEAMNSTMVTMMANLPQNNQLKDNDRAFAKVMIPHHQAAIDMARVILAYGKDPEVLAYAKMLISNEQIEIEQMSTYTK